MSLRLYKGQGHSGLCRVWGTLALFITEINLQIPVGVLNIDPETVTFLYENYPSYLEF